MDQFTRQHTSTNFELIKEKLRSLSNPYLSPKEVALILKKDTKTIGEWCKTGKLPATSIPFGRKTTYQITPKAVEMLIETQENLHAATFTHKKITDYKPYFEGWRKSMATGLMTGRAFSHHTIDHYTSSVEKFLKKYKELNIQNIKAELSAIPPLMFAKRAKFHRGIISFSKYLVSENIAPSLLLTQVTEKTLYPRRIREPKQVVVSEEDLTLLLSTCKTPMMRALVLLLSSTGMRANECAQLDLDDIDLDNKEVLIRYGKGGKTRTLGLNLITLEAIKEYLQSRPLVKTKSLFLSRFKNRIRRDCVYLRIKKLAKQSGIDASPHALRRRFVTFHLNTGKNPKKVQIACGHSSITTTMMYNQTDERDVVNDMKNW